MQTLPEGRVETVQSLYGTFLAVIAAKAGSMRALKESMYNNFARSAQEDDVTGT
jgi:hypothetical protein